MTAPSSSAKKVFLSDEWIAELQNLAAPLDQIRSTRLNVRVTGGPDGDRELHVDGLDIAFGLLDDAPTTIVVPYETARRMLLEESDDLLQLVGPALMGGEVQVQGDLNALMGLLGALGGSGLSTNDQQTIVRILRGRVLELTA